MATYEVKHSYEAYRDGLRFGPWVEGDVVSLDDADAAWIERDSAGVLARVKDQESTGPAVPVPAGGARPRVGGDPGLAEAAAFAQERVHAESVARQKSDADTVDDEDQDDADAEPADGTTRQKRGTRDRQHRGGRDRSG